MIKTSCFYDHNHMDDTVSLLPCIKCFIPEKCVKKELVLIALFYPILHRGNSCLQFLEFKKYVTKHLKKT